MNSTAQQTPARPNRVAVAYNQAVNVFWSVLSFWPISYFWYGHSEPLLLCSLLTVSILSGFLPKPIWHRIQLSNTPATYHTIGIRWVRKVTQDGDWVNRRIRQRYPTYRVIRRQVPIRKQLARMDLNERFHFMLSVFYLGTSVAAVVLGEIGWALVITVINVFFNVYPILLQQYNRLRIRQISERQSVKRPHAEP